MDLPVLNQLEKIYPNSDTGADAIRKIVKNQNIIVKGIEDAQLIEGPQGPQGEQGPQGNPGTDGVDGNTPYIGENGNWWIGDTDTGVSAGGAHDLTALQNQVNNLFNNRVTITYDSDNTTYGTCSLNISSSSQPSNNIYPSIGFIQRGVSDANLVMKDRKFYKKTSTDDNYYELAECSSFEATLLNGWAINATNDNVIVCKTGNIVNITGVVKNDETVSSGSVIMTLPTGYRPTKLRRTYAVTVNEISNLDVDTNGNVVWYGGTKVVSATRLNITFSC